MKNTIFLLGAKDPEMDIIQELLEEKHLNFQFARASNGRSNATNAYQSINDLSRYKRAIFIECDNINPPNISTFIDHHREGDFGYEYDYNFFLKASSLGQLISLLINEGLMDDLYEETCSDELQVNEYTYFKNKWMFKKNNEVCFVIPEKYVRIAAIDHDLSAVYEGKCKGISMDDVRSERIKDIGITAEGERELIALFSRYEGIFKGENKNILNLTHLDLGVGYTMDYLCLRELSMIKRQPIFIKTKDYGDDRSKFIFIGVTKDFVTRVLEERTYKNYTFVEVFGVPNRRYVGGFTKEGE